MTVSVMQIILLVVAAVCAFLGFNVGKKVEAPRAERRGRDQAYRDVESATTKHTLEQVNAANEAGAAVERRTADGVRVEAGSDPHNIGRVQRP